MSADNRSTSTTHKIVPNMKAEAQRTLLSHVAQLEGATPEKVAQHFKVSLTEAYLYCGTLHTLKEGIIRRLTVKEKKVKEESVSK